MKSIQVKNFSLFLLMVLMVLAFGFVVTGCSSTTESSSVEENAVAKTDKSAIYHLQKQGVSVDRMGENIMINIPSSLLFDGYSAALTGAANSVLSMVADIIEPMTKVEVNITAYSASEKQSKKDLLVTDLQAQNVARRLWRLGVDARLMYSTGMGGGHPVSVNKEGQPVGSINSRVVIVLKDLSGY